MAVANSPLGALKPVASARTYTNLRIFNAVMGVLHLLQGFIMLALSNNFALPLTTAYLKFNPVTRTLAPDLQTVGSLHIGPAVAVFLFLSAAAHFSLATFGYRWYVRNLERGMNPARWYEYALSSSLMIVLIAMLCGAYDLASLVLLFAINAAMNLFGLVMEKHNQTTARVDWTSYLFGCFAGLVPWVVIGLYLAGAAQSVNTQIPGFVYAIIASIFVFFNIFALNMFLQYKQVGPWKNYLFGERMYIVLSLVAKSALAWQIFSGTLRPQ